MTKNMLKNDGILEKGYGIIAKKVMKDKGLSIEAKSIYAYLSSYSGTGNTAYPSVSLICGDLKISEARFYKHRKFLEEKGYVVIEKSRDDKGWQNNIYRLPLIPTPQNLSTQNLSTQNRGTNNNSSNNNSFKSNSSNNDVRKERFNEFWELYPNKKAKKPARKHYLKNINEETHQTIMKNLKVMVNHKDWTKDNGKYIPLPTTYLNQERYNDEVKNFKQPKEKQDSSWAI